MMDEERNAIPYGNIMLARNAIRDVAPLRRNMQFDGMPSCIRSVVRETDMQRRTFLGTTVLGATLMTVSAPAVQAANTEWDKTFALDDRVAHEKVRFTNRFGIELAADLYRPKNLTGKLPAIAVSGPFGAVKEQASGLYAQELAIRGFVTVAFDPSFTGESGGVARNVASPDINAEDFSAAVDYLSLRDDVDPEKIGICGNDAVLVTGLGPVGLAALMLAKAMGANMLIGVEMNEYRVELAKKLGLVDYVFTPDEAMEGIMKVTNGHGVERAIDASASDPGRQLAIRATREWGKIAFVGEGGTCTFNPSPDIIHGQKTIYGSWVTSLWRMEELVERLVRWGIHPEDLITHEFPLEKAGEAYALMAGGNCGKVAVVFD